MKDIPGYEGVYQADEDGNIFSVERWVDHAKSGKQFVPAKKRALSIHNTGYLTIRLAKGGVVKTHRVHRLIAETFLPKGMGDGNEVNHKNGVKTDNRLCNLEWCSPAENIAHAHATGLANFSGVRNPSAKLSMADIILIHDAVLRGAPINELAFEYGVNRNTIPKALDREFGPWWRIHQKPQYAKKLAGHNYPATSSGGFRIVS